MLIAPKNLYRSQHVVVQNTLEMTNTLQGDIDFGVSHSLAWQKSVC